MTIPIEILAAVIGLVGMPIIGLQAWTLISVVMLREHFIELRKDLDGLDCRKLPPVLCEKKKKSISRRILGSIAFMALLLFVSSLVLLMSAFTNIP